MGLLTRGERALATRSTLGIWLGVGAIGSITMAVFGTVVGALPSAGASGWWFHLSTARSWSNIAFYLGAALLAAGWLGVGTFARAGQLRLSEAWLALGLWGIPLLLAPPLFSRDLYSYVVQGLLAHQGMNPYTTSPSVLSSTAAFQGIASVWQHTPAPYGPLSALVANAAAGLAGSSLVAQIIVMRLPELCGMALMMVFIPRLCRRLGADPGVGVWLAVLSPLAIVSFLASGHNEGLMLGLMVMGIALVMEERVAVGFTAIAAAATIKLPAIAGIALLAMERFRTRPKDRARLIVMAVGIPAVVWLALTLLTGFGFGWLSPTAIQIPTQIRTLATPSVALGVFIASILHALGLGIETHAVVTVTRTVVTLSTVATVLWLFLNVQRYEVVRILGLALLVVAIGSPTLWPWYFTWGITVLAATSAQRSKALAALAVAAVFMVNASGTPTLQTHSYLVTAPALILGVVWLVRGGRWRRTLETSVD